MIRQYFTVEFFFILVLFGAVLIRNIFLSSSLMPFEGWDEYQHLAVMTYYEEHNSMPTLNLDTVSASMGDFLLRHPHPSASAKQLAALGARNYKGEIWQDGQWVAPGKFVSSGRSNPMPRLYQAQHGPLYYQVTVFVQRFFGIESYESRADTARLFNSVCGAFTAVFWFLILTAVLRETRFAYLPYLVLLVFAANSIFAFNSGRVANDAFANLLATIAVYIYVRFGKSLVYKSFSRSLLLSACLGVLCGLAVLAKATAIAVLPTVMIGFLVSGICRRECFFRAIFLCCIALGAYVLTAGEYHADSLQKYGGITAMQEAVDNRNNDKGVAELIQIIPTMPLNYYLVSLNQLHTGGWSFGRARPVFSFLWKGSLGIMIVALFASIIASLSKSITRDAIDSSGKFRLRGTTGNRFKGVWPNLWELVLLCMIMWGALLYHSFHCMLARGYVATNPWYATIIFPILLALLLLGLAAWRCIASILMTVFLFILFCLSYYTGTYLDLLLMMTNESDYYRAITLINNHHGFLRLPGTFLYLELAFYILLAILAMVAWRKKEKP